MAKPPIPGRVKTRLTPTLSPPQAAAVHAAMLATLIVRLDRFVQRGHATLTLALAVPDTPAATRLPTESLSSLFADHPAARDALLAAHLNLLAQGTGDLGQRIRNAWLADTPAVVLGIDSPDLPDSHLHAALAVAAPSPPPSCPADHFSPHAAIGPTGDGGYWTLAAPRRPDPMLTNIDWGTPAVYDQSHRSAHAAGLTLVDLPHWHDVDTPQDLQQLRHRLADAHDPALQQLAEQLQTLVR